MRKLAAILSLVVLTALSGAAFGAELVMNGSTTVLPIAQAAAEKYMEADSAMKISVSGGGKRQRHQGHHRRDHRHRQFLQVHQAVRGESRGGEGNYPVPFAVAMDALLPIVHPENPVQDLSIEQLRDIYTGKIKSWKDVGGEDKPIAVVGRDTSSGTYETWQEIILKKERVSPRALIVASSGAMLTTVAKNKYAIGYDGIGYINNTVKPLMVNGKKGSAETALDGSYPIARFLYMFTKGWPAGEIMKFLNFMLSDEGQRIVASTGFVPLRVLK